MSRSKNPVLSVKHLKALGLIEKGGMSLKSIAAAVGWKEDYLYELHEGDTSKAGAVASLFTAECRRIDKNITQRIKDLAKSNKALAHELIHETLLRVKTVKKRTEREEKLISTMMNALAKATPNVEIGSVSYSYTKGYTPEQLVHEFKRLSTLAGGSSNRGAVQETVTGGSRALPDIAKSGDSTEEEL